MNVIMQQKTTNGIKKPKTTTNKSSLKITVKQYNKIDKWGRMWLH